MLNLLNKNRNLREDVDKLQFVRGDLIQTERRCRLRELAKNLTVGRSKESPRVVEGNCAGGAGTIEGCHSSPERTVRSNDDLLEETRHRLSVLEEASEQFLHSSHTPL